MSTFMDLTKKELMEAAEFFGVEAKPADSKKTIADSLADSGIDMDQYNKFFGPQEQEDLEGEPLPEQTEKVVDPSDALLMKMERGNPTYEVRGYRFTSTHPYALVAEIDAEWILENERGFRLASPKEVKEFYG